MGLISRVSSRTYRDFLKMAETRVICKKILREIYRIQAFSQRTTMQDVRNSQMYQGVMEQYRRHQHSTNINCRHLKAAEQDQRSFLTYLQANKTHRDLLQEYHTKGERSVAEAANLVGLKTPGQYPNDS